MDIFILDDAQMKQLKEFAERKENRYDLQHMRMIIAGLAPPAGEVLGQFLDLPLGDKVVYSIEEHPGGWMRHMSMSCASPNKTPNLYAVHLVLESLGFKVNLLERGPKHAHIDVDKGVVDIIEPFNEP